ncbi:MAG TPA: DNA polymerase III subunit gamma/tau [Ktedonobacteraceae bacterium]
MASQSLYRKWRSQTFDEMVGQEPIIRTLKNALHTQTLGHAYLFTGPRGTGKTTTARLLAKTVNCTNPRDGEPCNECQQCREITAGASFNVIEIDAASNRGIDNIRELRERVMTPPSLGRYKIYILDEAHMLTTEAFNALLKTLEEPPDYAIFVLATTDVHKMLPTVLSRCQRFDFKRISTRQIIDHLLFVAREEHIELETGAAGLIARAAAGGMRDALSLLDQAIAYAGEAVSLAQVQAMLGVADPRSISQLITHIAQLNSPALLYLIHELSEAGADLRQINAQVVEYWRALLLAKAGADIAEILDLTEDEMHDVRDLLPSFALAELTECARLFARNDLVQRNLATPQLGLELASLECLELHRRALSDEPVAQASSLAPLPTAASAPPRHLSAAASPVRRNPPAHSTTQEVGGGVGQAAQEQAVANAAPSETPARETNATHAPLTQQQVMAGWENVIRRTHQRSGLLAAFLKHWQVVGVEDSSEGVVVLLQAANQRHFENVRANDRPKDIEWALYTEFGQPCKVRLVPPGQPPIPLSYTRGAVLDAPPSAHRDRSAEPTTATTHAQVRPETPALADEPQPAVVAAQEIPSPSAAAPSGAKKSVQLSLQEAQQKAQQDPVVIEAVRVFGAKIKDVQPQ